jgi:hypothetical protein
MSDMVIGARESRKNPCLGESFEFGDEAQAARRSKATESAVHVFINKPYTPKSLLSVLQVPY